MRMKKKVQRREGTALEGSVASSLSLSLMWGEGAIGSINITSWLPYLGSAERRHCRKRMEEVQIAWLEMMHPILSLFDRDGQHVCASIEKQL